MTGNRYLKGFVVSKAAQDSWLVEKVEGWWESVATLDRVARQHLQNAYTVLHKSPQKEWAFVQRVTLDIWMAL